MLQNIREKFTGWIAIAILALIGFSFVFVGLNYSFIGSSFAAKVDGVDIGVAQFENTYRDQLQSNPQLAQLPEEYRQQLRSNILEQLIQQRVIDNYLVEAGYQISDEQIMAMIQRAPEFQVAPCSRKRATNRHNSKPLSVCRCDAISCSAPFVDPQWFRPRSTGAFSTLRRSNVLSRWRLSMPLQWPMRSS